MYLLTMAVTPINPSTREPKPMLTMRVGESIYDGWADAFFAILVANGFHPETAAEILYEEFAEKKVDDK